MERIARSTALFEVLEGQATLLYTSIMARILLTSRRFLYHVGAVMPRNRGRCATGAGKAIGVGAQDAVDIMEKAPESPNPHPYRIWNAIER